METLIIKTNLAGTEFYLGDCAGHHIGTFNSYAEAETWCKENGYKCRKY